MSLASAMHFSGGDVDGVLPNPDNAASGAKDAKVDPVATCPNKDMMGSKMGYVTSIRSFKHTNFDQ